MEMDDMLDTGVIPTQVVCHRISNITWCDPSVSVTQVFTSEEH